MTAGRPRNSTGWFYSRPRISNRASTIRLRGTSIRRIYFSGMNRQRLDFESTRDSLLAAVGQLDETRGGRAGDLADAAYRRRTIYGAIDRQNLPSVFRAFDFASPDASSPQRFTTTTPQQALYFLNSPFVIRQAKALAARPDIQFANPQARIAQLYRTLFAREATPQEDLGRSEVLASRSRFDGGQKRNAAIAVGEICTGALGVERVRVY